MDGGVVGGGGGAVGEGARDQAVVDVPGALDVGEGGLEREGVGVEPVEERGFAKNAGVGVLGGVDVGVWWAQLVKDCVSYQLESSHTYEAGEEKAIMFKVDEFRIIPALLGSIWSEIFHVSFDEGDLAGLVYTNRGAITYVQLIRRCAMDKRSAVDSPLETVNRHDWATYNCTVGGLWN
jgi:hypothetical protein